MLEITENIRSSFNHEPIQHEKLPHPSAKIGYVAKDQLSFVSIMYGQMRNGDYLTETYHVVVTELVDGLRRLEVLGKWFTNELDAMNEVLNIANERNLPVKMLYFHPTIHSATVGA